MKAIILMGIKHSGKSTQGKLLAQKYNIPFYDTDDIMEKLTGKTPRKILSTEGENAFIRAEKKACDFIAQEITKCKKIQTKEYSAVIATGGGICNNKDALAVLHEIGIFVFLFTEEKIASDRIVREAKVSEDGSISNLPAYIAKKNPHSITEVRDLFHSFYIERIKIYSSISDFTVQMIDAPKQENLERIDCAIN